MKNFLSDVDNPKHCENQAKRSDKDSNEKVYTVLQNTWKMINLQVKLN